MRRKLSLKPKVETEEFQLDRGRIAFVNMKRYEEMLVTEMLGTRHNEPLQAVIENQLHESALQEPDGSILERNRALLQYVATLANSNSKDDEFNYEFVESLVKGGADINTADQHEQSIFHEVARSRNTDVAKFLLDNGCDINKKDSFGRTPLHVAATVDFVEMTEFLLKNNADIDAKTFGEGQTPIHYAAKNGATRSLKMLLGFNANIDSPDAKRRTPLQLSAEWTREKSAKVLINEGAASCLLDSTGNSALNVLIDRLPNLAVEALNQLHTTDIITMKKSYYLQYLEASRQKIETKAVRFPLETAVGNRKYEVVTHPVMQRLIHNKWKQFGRLSTIFDLLFHIVFGIAWTAFCMGTPARGKDLYYEQKARVWRSVVGSFILLMTVYDIAVHIHSTVKSRRSQANWIKWKSGELEDDLKYCHPRWPQEEKYVRQEVKRVRDLPLFDAYDAWFYMDWAILFLIVATIATHFAYFDIDTSATRYLYTRTISIVNLLVWLRLLKYVRPFPGIGTLVLILGETSSDFMNWAFLFFLLMIPFSSAFWITFGENSLHPVVGYDETGALLYSVFRIAVGDEFRFEEMAEADPVMSRILVTFYVTAISIVTLNLLIALLTDTFSRVYGNAVANTIMQRAIKVVEAERMLSQKKRMEHKEYMKFNCSPEVINIKVESFISPSAKRIPEVEMSQNLMELKDVLVDRFGVKYGKEKSSDFDAVVDDTNLLKREQDKVTNDIKNITEMIKVLAEQKKLQNNQVMSQSEPPKSLMTALQHTAVSFIPGWLAGNMVGNGENEYASQSKSGRHSDRMDKEGSPTSRRERRKQKRREKRMRKDDEDSASIPNQRRRGRRLENPGRLSYYDLGGDEARGVGFPNLSFLNDRDLDWDNVSIDSASL